MSNIENDMHENCRPRAQRLVDLIFEMTAIVKLGEPSQEKGVLPKSAPAIQREQNHADQTETTGRNCTLRCSSAIEKVEEKCSAMSNLGFTQHLWNRSKRSEVDLMWQRPSG